MKIKLEEARKSDYPEIAKIYSEEFSKPPYNENWTIKKAEDKLNIFSRYCDIWKIVLDGKIVGFVIMNPNQWCPGEVVFGEEMAVKSSFQGNGIATSALKELIEIYRKQGFEKFMGIVNKRCKVMKVYGGLGIGESKDYVVVEEDLR